MAGSFRDLTVCKKAFTLAMEIFETQVSLDFAEACKYISQEENRELHNQSEEVGRMLNHMVENPEKYGLKSLIRKEVAKLPTAFCQLPTCV